MESLEQRKAGVEGFLLHCGVSRPAGDAPVMDIVEIEDAFGPTAHDPDIQALVVSRETTSGGNEVLKVRKEKELPPLEIFTIDVLSSQISNAGRDGSSKDLKDVTDEKVLKEVKMGSTGIRQWIADHPNEA